MSIKGYSSQIDSSSFSIRSQTNPNNRYMVSITDNGLVCECLDHTTRKADCKQIKIVLDVMKKNQCHKNNTFRIMERSQLKLCKFCDSRNIKKMGFRKTKSGEVRVFGCKDCKKRFTTNFSFKRMRNNSRAIIQAVQMYYQGMSVRDISDNFEMMRIDVSFRVVYE